MIDLEEVRADLAALDDTDHSSAARVAAHVPTLLSEVEQLERLRDFDTGTTPLPKGLMLEYTRLDGMWQKLVRERDDARAEAADQTKWADTYHRKLQEAEAEVERLRGVIEDCAKLIQAEAPATAARLRRYESPYPPRTVPTRDPEALLIPSGGTGVVDFTCGLCGKRNVITVLIDAGETANLPLACGCDMERLTSVEVKPYDTRWRSPDQR